MEKVTTKKVKATKKVKTLKEVVLGVLERSKKPLALKTVYERVAKRKASSPRNSVRARLCENIGRKKGMIKKTKDGLYSIV